MRVAEELRKHADLAIKEGGMYYSGEYLDAVARRAESEQAKNAKLQETCDELREACAELLDMAESHDPEWFHWPEVYKELRRLGVEV